MEELKRKVSVLLNTILDLKCNTSNKSCKIYINHLQSNILELQDVNLLLNRQVEHLIKLVPFK